MTNFFFFGGRLPQFYNLQSLPPVISFDLVLFDPLLCFCFVKGQNVSGGEHGGNNGDFSSGFSMCMNSFKALQMTSVSFGSILVELDTTIVQLLFYTRKHEIMLSWTPHSSLWWNIHSVPKTCLAEEDNVPHSPPVHLHRWPVRTKKHLQMNLQKVLLLMFHQEAY